MYWKRKALIQRVVSYLPQGISYGAYYAIQRRFGGLRRVNPISRLKAGIAVCDRIRASGETPVDSVILEVGTGRRLNMPLAFWLQGAQRIFTVDLNPYLKEELVRDDLRYLAQNVEEIAKLFGQHLLDERLTQLVNFTQSAWRLPDLLKFLSIEYVAPGDATQLRQLESGTVDFHTSYTVLEHIPGEVIDGILREAGRLLRSGGLSIHCIDYSDHFSHSDKTINAINFLQFDEAKWDRLAGNQYMYMNRLRCDDMRSLFEKAGHEVLRDEITTEPALLEILKAGRAPIHSRFASKSAEVLATTSSWIVSRVGESEVGCHRLPEGTKREAA